jgi:D-aminopeptidase
MSKRTEGAGKGQADQRFAAWSAEGEPVVDFDVDEAPTDRKRVRALRPFLGTFRTGRHNAITDVKGVRIGHCTVVKGHGKLVVGEGPVRSGVTVVLPTTPKKDGSDSIFLERLAASGHVLNGAGEMIGLTQVMEWGLLESPIALTNTLSAGVVHDAMVRHMIREVPEIGRAHDTVIPIVAECDDSWLSDITGRHIDASHVDAAIADAMSARGTGVVKEGAVGSGSGMTTCDFAGGIGTSSRLMSADEGGFTVGVLVQSNFGKMGDLRMGGVPVGALLEPRYTQLRRRGGDYGSIIVIVATDAPLDARQLRRVSQRAALGITRTGSVAGHGSGEIVLAFSTANRFPRVQAPRVLRLDVLAEDHIDPIFRATIDATEEAILNALCMATDVVGVNHHSVPAVPLDAVAAFIDAYTPPSLRAQPT